MTKFQSKRIIVKNRNTVFFLLPNEIEFIATRSHWKKPTNPTVTDSKITYVVTSNLQEISSFQLLGEWERQLETHDCFLRVSQSCIVNCDHVRNVRLLDNEVIIELSSEQQIKVTRRFLSRVRENLQF